MSLQRPACMDDTEWDLWSATVRAFPWSNGRIPQSPCLDCLPAFCAEMRAIDRCDGEPGIRFHPDTAQRRSWRESKARAAARAAGYRGSLGVVFTQQGALK